MEWHRIIDFGFDPRQQAVWVRLDAPPSEGWRAGLCRPADFGDDVPLSPGIDRLPVPAIAREWVHLDAIHLDELDALAVVCAYIHRANAMSRAAAP